jgi:hypothetical protein
VAGLAALASLAFACVRTEAYLYSAQKYDPAADCVTGYESVELVNGTGASSQCEPSCLSVNGELYVSTMCPPLPTIATEVPVDSGACVAALAAAAREAGACEAPGPAGEPSGDAGPVSEAGPDPASPDASDQDSSDGSKPIVDAAEAG